MKISRVALAVTTVLSLAAVSAPASAALVVYDWSLTTVSGGGGLNAPGSGTLTIDTSMTSTVEGYSADKIVAVTGTVGGQAITSSAPTAFFGADNEFFQAGTAPIDDNGFSFTTAAGNFNVFSFFAEGTVPSGNAFAEEGPPAIGNGVGEFTATLAPVPLPASGWMLLLGLGGVGFVARRAKPSKVGSTGIQAV